MSIQPSIDLVTILRHNFHAIDWAGDEAAYPSVRKLKSILARRIMVIEAAMRCIEKLASAASLVSVDAPSPGESSFLKRAALATAGQNRFLACLKI
jgi:hypothetical protein